MSEAMDVDPEPQCFDCADQDEEPEDEEYFQLAHGLAKGFEDLVADVGKARDARRERMAFKSAAEMADEMVNSDRVALNEDERQQLGEWLPGDEYQGDVNMRTLDRLLKRVDQRGFERSAQQLEVPPARSRVQGASLTPSAERAQFHQAFMRACGRVLYREDWATRKPEIMAKHGWDRCNSEVLIRSENALERTQTTRITNRARSCPAQHAAALREDIFVRAFARTLAHFFGFCRFLWISIILALYSGSAPHLIPRAQHRHLLRVHGIDFRPRNRCALAYNEMIAAARSRFFRLGAVVFSPARRASRKLLERVRTETEQQIAGTVPVIFCSVSVQIVECVRLAGGDTKICEYVRAPTLFFIRALTRSPALQNQEACRLEAFDGRKSLVRSFPSKVGVSALATRTRARGGKGGERWPQKSQFGCDIWPASEH